MKLLFTILVCSTLSAGILDNKFLNTNMNAGLVSFGYSPLDGTMGATWQVTKFLSVEFNQTPNYTYSLNENNINTDYLYVATGTREYEIVLIPDLEDGYISPLWIEYDLQTEDKIYGDIRTSISDSKYIKIPNFDNYEIVVNRDYRYDLSKDYNPINDLKIKLHFDLY